MKSHDRHCRKTQAAPQAPQETESAPVHVLEPETAAFPGLLRITVGKETFVYWFREIESQLGGRGFELRKFKLDRPVPRPHFRRPRRVQLRLPRV